MCWAHFSFAAFLQGERSYMNSRLKDPAALKPLPASRPPENNSAQTTQQVTVPNVQPLWALPANEPHRKKTCIGVESKGILLVDTYVKVLVCQLRNTGPQSDGRAKLTVQRMRTWALSRVPRIRQWLNPTLHRFWAAFIWTVSSVLELRGFGFQNKSSDLSLLGKGQSCHKTGRGEKRGGAPTGKVPTHHAHTRAVGSAVISLKPHYSSALWVVWCALNRGMWFGSKTYCSTAVCSGEGEGKT